jgi:hypothetical protein
VVNELDLNILSQARMSTEKEITKTEKTEFPILFFELQEEWRAWLEKN